MINRLVSKRIVFPLQLYRTMSNDKVSSSCPRMIPCLCPLPSAPSPRSMIWWSSELAVVALHVLSVLHPTVQQWL